MAVTKNATGAGSLGYMRGRCGNKRESITQGLVFYRQDSYGLTSLFRCGRVWK